MDKLPEKVEIALTDKLADNAMVLKTFEIIDIIEDSIYQNAYIRATCGFQYHNGEIVMLASISWDKVCWNNNWYRFNLINIIPESTFNVFKYLLSMKEAMPYEPSIKEQAADPLMV